MPESLESVFELEPPKGGSPADAYKDRVRAALEAHGERQKPARPGQRAIGLNEFLGIGRTEEPEPNAKRTDLNEPARKWMKEQGWSFERVDYYDARTERHHDLLGMFDYLAFRGSETIGVQITSRGQISARKNKILAEKRLEWLRRAGWRAVVLGFDKGAPEGGAKGNPNTGANNRWRCKEEWIL